MFITTQIYIIQVQCMWNLSFINAKNSHPHMHSNCKIWACEILPDWNLVMYSSAVFALGLFSKHCLTPPVAAVHRYMALKIRNRRIVNLAFTANMCVSYRGCFYSASVCINIKGNVFSVKQINQNESEMFLDRWSCNKREQSVN